MSTYENVIDLRCHTPALLHLVMRRNSRVLNQEASITSFLPFSKMKMSEMFTFLVSELGRQTLTRSQLSPVPGAALKSPNTN